MALGRRRRNRYKFTEKAHSRKGIAGTALGAALLGLYIGFVILSYRGNGNLSMYYGSIGVLAILGTIADLVLAIQSMKEEESFPLFPRLALLVSLLAVASWVGTYALGILI